MSTGRLVPSAAPSYGAGIWHVQVGGENLPVQL